MNAMEMYESLNLNKPRGKCHSKCSMELETETKGEKASEQMPEKFSMKIQDA